MAEVASLRIRLREAVAELESVLNVWNEMDDAQRGECAGWLDEDVFELTLIVSELTHSHRLPFTWTDFFVLAALAGMVIACAYVWAGQATSEL